MDGGTDVRPLIVHHCIFIVLRAGANSTVTLTDGVTDIPVLTYALGALNISTGTDWHPPQIVSGFSGLTLNTIHTHHRAQKSRATRLLSSRRRRSWACRCSPGPSTSFFSPTTRLMPVRHLLLLLPFRRRDGYEWLDVHHLISTCLTRHCPGLHEHHGLLVGRQYRDRQHGPELDRHRQGDLPARSSRCGTLRPCPSGG